MNCTHTSESSINRSAAACLSSLSAASRAESCSRSAPAFSAAARSLVANAFALSLLPFFPQPVSTAIRHRAIKIPAGPFLLIIQLSMITPGHTSVSYPTTDRTKFPPWSFMFTILSHMTERTSAHIKSRGADLQASAASRRPIFLFTSD